MDRLLYRSSLVLAAIGILVSVYMTIFKLTQNESMCLGNGGCSVVNNSSYAVVYGVPVAVVGIGGYTVIFAALLLHSRISFLQLNGILLVFGLALAGFLFSLYLVYVEVALIHALCPFCVTSQISMTLLFIFSVVRLAREPAI